MLAGNDLSALVLIFFTYSFLGYLMECVVLSIDHRRLVYDRGFVRHLPFCIIYGFGALAGYILLQQHRDNLPVLFLAGACLATLFEYLVARLQIHLFGDFWWDYSQKPCNYRGMLCLESTVGWGVAAIVVIRYVHGMVEYAVRAVPSRITQPLALLLIVLYAGDFLFCARAASAEKMKKNFGAAVELGEESTGGKMAK